MRMSNSRVMRLFGNLRRWTGEVTRREHLAACRCEDAKPGSTMLADVYVLANERTAAAAASFLNRFLPDRISTAGNYPVPQYADPPQNVFSDPADVIEWCASRSDQAYSLYWLNARPASEPHSAHIFFLADGGMVLGLSTRCDDAGEPEELLRVLRSVAKSHVGYWTLEQPPAPTSREFRRMAGVA